MLMNRFLCIACIGLMGFALAAPLLSAEPQKHDPWVALGGSITEGFTYPLWVSQSLGAASEPTPVWVNAGVGGDTAARMLKRLDHDVLRHKPARVFLSVGINDVMTGQSPQFEGHVNAILQQLGKQGVPVCIITTTALGAKHAHLNPKLAAMNDFLRQRAAESGYPVAEVFTPFLQAVQAGRPVLEADDVHLTLEGYRIMSAAVLRAIEPAVALSPSFDPAPEPVIVKTWTLRKTESSEPIATISLPDSVVLANWWHDQERKRGFALNLKRFAPDTERFHAAGEFLLPAAGPVRIQVGAGVYALKIDGLPFPLAHSNLKWGIRDAGSAAILSQGTHRIEAIVGDAFFVSCTPEQQPR